MKQIWMIFLFAAGVAAAEMLVEETFDGGSSGGLAHKASFQSSGTGLSKGWKAWLPKQAGIVEIADDGLNGRTLVLCGSADNSKEGAQVMAFLDQPVDFSQDETVYVSFLFKNLDRSKFSSDYCQITLKQSAGNITLAGFGMDSDETVMVNCMKENSTGSKTLKEKAIYRFVAKIECHAGKPDVLSVRAFSPANVTLEEPEQWDVVLECAADGMADKLMAVASFGNSKAMFDEIRIGTTYADVIAQ